MHGFPSIAVESLAPCKRCTYREEGRNRRRGKREEVRREGGKGGRTPFLHWAKNWQWQGR
jgi:hypothetical protein